MNNQLIEKVIKCSNDSCPQFDYDNPVLDRKVAGALAKGLVKILKVSSQNSNINNNLRLSALENIKRMCQVESENHFKTDENFTQLLTEVYSKNAKDKTDKASNSTEILIDAFLIRSLKVIETNPTTKSCTNPEILQALTNLDENGAHIESLAKDVIHWSSDNKRNLNVVKNIWTSCLELDIYMSNATLDDISIKMKADIEQILLGSCRKCLENQDTNLENLFNSDKSLVHLVKTSARSSNCFQICINILNDLFLKSNYDSMMQRFINTFVSYVKLHSNSISISTLYPSHLSNTVLLLDIDLKKLPLETRDSYIKTVMPHLINLHQKSDNDFILLLSNYPDWFDIYFEKF